MKRSFFQRGLMYIFHRRINDVSATVLYVFLKLKPLEISFSSMKGHLAGLQRPVFFLIVSEVPEAEFSIINFSKEDTVCHFKIYIC